MMIVCLVLAAFVWVAFARWARRGGSVLLGVAALLATAAAVVFQSHALSLQLVGFVAMWAVWAVASRHPRAAAPLAMLGLLGPLAWVAGGEARRLDALRVAVPMESFADRLAGHPPLTTDPLTSRAAAALDGAAPRTRLRDWSRGPWGDFRNQQLADLHGHAVWAFLRAPGFGRGRMTTQFQPSESVLLLNPRPAAPPQPGPRTTVPWRSSGTAESATWDDLEDLHEASQLDFFQLPSLGYTSGPKRGAGFEPHAFTDVPFGSRGLKMLTLDLIGFVVHPTPVAYVSDTLPAMAAIRDTPTRPLDAFERFGYDALMTGESLYARRFDRHVRALGAIRAGRQCTTCHDCERGDLLGAFSYTLEATP